MELRDHEKEESLYWEVYIGRVYTVFFSENMLLTLNSFKYFNQSKVFNVQSSTNT